MASDIVDVVNAIGEQMRPVVKMIQGLECDLQYAKLSSLVSHFLSDVAHLLDEANR